jgi:hypothetical protein
MSGEVWHVLVLIGACQAAPLSEVERIDDRWGEFEHWRR